MNSNIRPVAICFLAAVFAPALSFEGSPVIKDPSVFLDADDPSLPDTSFGTVEYFDFGGSYAIDSLATLNGNNVLAIHQLAGAPTEGTGAGFSFYGGSNGENGLDFTIDGQDENSDTPNDQPVNRAIDLSNGGDGTQGNRLENGNAVRFSAWFRSSPDAPLTFSPSVEPLLKFEIFKEALSANQDTNPGQVGANFGDEIFDQQQHGITIPVEPEDRNQWIDLNQDGVIGDDGLAAEDGRVSTISTDAWTLVSTTYTIDDFLWSEIGNNADTNFVEAVEEIRPVLFIGDFSIFAPTPNNLEQGTLLVDNLLFEVFSDRESADSAAVPNPDPSLDERPSLDANEDGVLTVADADLLCGTESHGELLTAIGSLPGDADGNGSVEFSDFLVLSATFGESGAKYSEGDFDCNGEIQFADFLILSANFGESAIAVSEVPEPSTAIMVLAGLAGAFLSRRSIRGAVGEILVEGTGSDTSIR